MCLGLGKVVPMEVLGMIWTFQSRSQGVWCVLSLSHLVLENSLQAIGVSHWVLRYVLWASGLSVGYGTVLWVLGLLVGSGANLVYLRPVKVVPVRALFVSGSLKWFFGQCYII